MATRVNEISPENSLTTNGVWVLTRVLKTRPHITCKSRGLGSWTDLIVPVAMKGVPLDI